MVNIRETRINDDGTLLLRDDDAPRIGDGILELPW
jgi:hypothetical protein